MQTLHPPLAGDHILRPKTHRRPLKPLNSQPNLTPQATKPPPPQECPQNKENTPLYNASQMIETTAAAMESSLADELIAMRKKIERIRVDRERTEKMLKEREAMLDLKMKEIEKMSQVQKMVEIDVDRVFRSNQLHSLATRFSPIRSLRQKEQQKKANGSTPVKVVNFEETEESVGENTPGKTSSASIEESEIVTASEATTIESVV